jgi:hypothetical protein
MESGRPGKYQLKNPMYKFAVNANLMEMPLTAIDGPARSRLLAIKT